MKFLRMLGLAAVAAALSMLVVAGTASATVLTGSGGSTLGTGTELKAENEGTFVLDAPFGNVECKKSSLAGKTTNAGGSSENVSANVETLSFSECNATVTVLAKGTLSIEGTSSNNGTLRGSGNEVTVEFIGTHCIFKTSNTSIGTVTGSATTGGNATLDISATIPRTGGRSGVFCGSSAPWTGSYKFTTPSTLNIDSGGGGGGKTSTTITTSLSGESKSGAEITVNEGSKVKDTATLSGTNAGKATGTVKYKVYADKECKELVTSAGEVTVTGGSVPASEEKELEAGRVYYWQAEYSGDSSNEASKSTCGKEILTIKAKTSISTSLSGESKSGEEITVNEGSKAKDTATLSGTRSSSATGKVKFKAYKDKECKELASEAGEGSLSEGKATSEEKALEAGAVYYWLAEYAGDSLHQASTSTCGKEVLTVKAATSISTSLSGEAKSGEEITILEGSKAKDTATLSGTRSSAATGKAKYKVYADSECKELVSEAGEVTVSEGKAPASEEKTLEAGRTYYWQATYEGDSLHQASTSTCGKEILKVKASTSLSTSLSGEAKSGEEITVNEGSKAKDTATLSGTRSSSATGKVKFKAYKDKECKELASEAGEGSLSEGKATSEEKALEAGAVYYWQAEYAGDSLHQASTSSCGKEVLTVKAATSLSTSLRGEHSGGGEPIEGEEIVVAVGSVVSDAASLSGTNASTASGEVGFGVYADARCEEILVEAGEASLEEGTAAPSKEVELEEGTYYWQASYDGDALHQPSTSPCTEILHVIAGTSLATMLSGEGEEGDGIEVSEEALVTDTATLTGAKAAEATGSVEYFVYSNIDCTELAAEAGKVTVAGESVPASNNVALEPGLYYWQAVYSGDGLNHASTSACGSEIEVVVPAVTTTLTGGGESAGHIKVLAGTSVHDEATLHGKHASEATGSVSYLVYSDEECKELVAEAGAVEVNGARVPASSAVKLEAPGIYYWQASYSGDEQNPAGTSACGTEVSMVTAPTSLTTSLSGGSKEGAEILVEEGTAVGDQAMLSGAEVASATGSVKYTVYRDSSCTEVAAPSSVGHVEEGVGEASGEVTLPPGTYYWQAEYRGDGVNSESIEGCGAEVLRVTAPITTSLAGGSQSGTEIQVPEGTSVTDQATLHGKHAEEASGSIEYLVYADAECKELFAEAGKFEFEEGEVPASSSVEFTSGGIYYWRARYSGDSENSAASSPCGSEDVQVVDPLHWQYAAFGDSYSAGQGVRQDPGGTFYPPTDLRGRNMCHRSEQAWPALVAETAFGAGALAPPTIYERPPPSRFIFRACTGAETINVWNVGAGAPNGGLYDEYEEPGAVWRRTPAQLTWLPAPPGFNPRVARVSLTIGGNDAGFRPVAEACWAFSRSDFPHWLVGDYDPAPCRAAIAHWEGVGFPQIEAVLPLILRTIEARAPNALIRVFLYPHVLNLGLLEIPVSRGLVVNNDPATGAPTAAEALDDYITELNQTITKTVVAAGVPRTQVIPNTENALTRFGNHRLGDPVPWLNGVVGPREESFHPNICGYRAVAALTQAFLAPAAPPIAPCP